MKGTVSGCVGGWVGGWVGRGLSSVKFTVGELVGLALCQVSGGLSCSRHVGWCVDGDGDGCGCVKFTVGELVGLALREVDGGLSCGGHVGGWRGEGEGGGSQPPTTNMSMRHIFF